MYDDLQTISTHFEPVWRGEMWGIWQTDPRGKIRGGTVRDTHARHGVFSCRKGAWPGFNPMFRGFGWEEGYIHEKVRRRAVPLLALAAMDASLRQACRYRVSSYRRRETQELRHRARRAWVGSHPVLAHFSEILPEDHVVAVAAEVLEGRHRPPNQRR